jgi:single-strand DNA-binding protein
MSGLNKVMIIGRLGQDPELKTVGSSQVARLSIATSETYTDKNNQKQEKTEWHRVIFWGKLAELAGKYLSKGRQVYVEGKLQTRSWEENGQKRYATEIIGSSMQFLGDAGSKQGGPSQGQGGYNDYGQPPTGFNADDEIPF